MTGTPDESRSWPEGADADQAVEALKIGLQRLHGRVAEFRHQIGADSGDERAGDEQP